MGAKKDPASPTKNQVVRRFLEEAYRIHSTEGATVMNTQEIFEAIDLPFNFDVITYMRKLDFIREESGSMFSLTERGKDMGQKE